MTIPRTPKPDRFEKLYRELLDYMLLHLLKVPRCADTSDSEKLWVCPEVYQKTISCCGDSDFGWMHQLKNVLYGETVELD